jgi:transglutaminase-like putative cysteine protease
VLNRLRDRLAALPRDSRDTLFLLSVIGWVVLPQAANLPLWCSIMTGGVLLWRGWLAWSSRRLPSAWWVAGLLAMAVVATLVTHRTVLGRDAGVTLTVVLLALKTLELRARRDAFVVFFLSFFVMLTNFFFSQSLLTAASMLIALLGLLTALVNAHMPVGRPSLAQAARTAGGMALLGAPIMAALFLLFPRFAPLWGVPGDAMAGRSGLSSSMEVGNLASLVLDESIALRVRFEGPPPPQGLVYFRGPVFGAFDGREWSALNTRFSQRFRVPADLRVTGDPIRYEVTMEASRRPWIFTLEGTPQPPSLPGYELDPTPDLQWRSNRAITDIVRYRAESYLDFRHGPDRYQPGLAEYTALPEGFNPRTMALALEILNQVGGRDPARLVDAVLERLRTGGYRYTLEPGTYGRDSADEFWFDRKLGFCEHIASAFVILMRAMDVPARIVTGYQGGELNGVDGYWVIRQSDAHAWAEVWQAGKGWVRIDPTAAVSPGRIGLAQRLRPAPGVFASAVEAVSPGVLLNLRATWEAINNRWNQWVLNYTQNRQLDLLRDLGFSTPGWEDLVYLLLSLVVGVSLVGAGWTLWERRRQDPWLRLLARARARLRRVGIDSQASTPPRELAMLLHARFGDSAGAARDWLLRLERARYAAGDASLAARGLATLRQEFSLIPWPRS